MTNRITNNPESISDWEINCLEDQIRSYQVTKFRDKILYHAQVGNHDYWFIGRFDEKDKLEDSMSIFANNPQLNFTWRDMANLYNLSRELK